MKIKARSKAKQSKAVEIAAENVTAGSLPSVDSWVLDKNNSCSGFWELLNQQLREMESRRKS